MQAFTSARRAGAVIATLMLIVISAPLPVAAQEVQSFEIPAQALETALTAFSRQSGVQISASAGTIAGLSSPGASGDLTPEAALRQLLSGTGLSYRLEGPATAVLTQDPQSALAAEEVDLTLDAIIVQGELQDRTVQETQTSVAIITGAELERRSDFEVKSIIERSAGVSVSPRSGVTIRGITETGVTAAAGALTITTVVDGARVSNLGGGASLSFASTWDLDQVEILRGPQSTQSGRNALAGAVIVRSQDPTFDEELKIRLGAGNAGTFNGAFAANTPLIDDVLALRISGEIDRTEGFADNILLGTDDVDASLRKTFRGSLRFEPTDDLSAVLKVTYFESELGTDRVLSAFLPNQIVATPFQQETDTRFHSINLRLGYDLNDNFRLESDTTFFDREFDFTGFSDSVGEAFSFEQELKLFYQDARISAVLGGFFTRIEQEGAAANALFTSTSSDDVTNYAGFGEIEVNLLPELSLIAGMRYDREEVDVGSQVAFGPLNVNTQTNATFDAFLPKAGIVYDLTENASVGFTFQQAYRAGGASLNGFTGQQVSFDPERGNNYELAFRSEWLGGDLTVNANAFFTRYTDQQVVVTSINGGPANQDRTIVNAGESRSFGGEIDIKATPIPGLELFAGIGFVQTKFLDFLNNGQQLAGNEFVGAPTWTTGFGGTYTFENGIFFGADFSYTSKSFDDPENTRPVDSRFLSNLRAGYEAEHFGVFLYVDNLFDEAYLEANLGVGEARVGDPRTFGIVGQINF